MKLTWICDLSMWVPCRIPNFWVYYIIFRSPMDSAGIYKSRVHDANQIYFCKRFVCIVHLFILFSLYLSLCCCFWSQIPISSLVSFVEALEVGYSKHKNPYHNLIHAADVTQTVHYLLLKTGMVVSTLNYTVYLSAKKKSQNPDMLSHTVWLKVRKLRLIPTVFWFPFQCFFLFINKSNPFMEKGFARGRLWEHQHTFL